VHIGVTAPEVTIIGACEEVEAIGARNAERVWKETEGGVLKRSRTRVRAIAKDRRD
jgi:hypothetical protein